MLPTALHTKYTTVYTQLCNRNGNANRGRNDPKSQQATQRQKENYDTDASGARTHPSGRTPFPMTTRATDLRDEAERSRRRSSLVELQQASSSSCPQFMRVKSRFPRKRATQQRSTAILRQKQLMLIDE
ncbi:hypothetical protein CB0940_09920 [Cercospora beticola]|uniref:Uncharacterized protein n=1 Tax=Cercospora beticola TaxID=122368 RepID=A0A2G5HIM4_CERBT|nr:hypothetical protein CB0940_09920 [Cercospora beticola]PIA92379.1 hypothetical protein CB0940_09920 [Cercospora beticola]